MVRERDRRWFTGHRAWPWVGLAAILSLLMVVLIAPPGQPPPITLTDGSVLRFDGVSFGTNHVRHYGSWAGRMARQLPASVRRWLPPAVSLRYASRESSLIFWLRKGAAFETQKFLRFTLADEDGTAVPLATPVMSRMLANGTTAFALAESVWPRTARHLVLSVFDERLDSPNQLAGRWTLSNPHRVARRPWTSAQRADEHPGHPPVSRRVDDIVLTLEQFEVRPVPMMLGRLSGTNLIEPLAFLEFRSTNAAGNSRSAWQLRAARLRDAMGNVRPWQPVGESSSGQGNTFWVGYMKLPWPAERVYQVETRWWSPDSGPDRELLTVPDLAMAVPGEVRSVLGGGRFSAGEFRIMGEIAELGTNRVCRLDADLIRNPSDPAAHQIRILEVRASDGRRWVPDEKGKAQIPAAVSVVSVTVEVCALRPVEFIVEPIRRSSNLPTRR